MGKSIDFLGVIPARGGSKGIPRKNVKVIAGKPLIAWSILAAQKADTLNRFVVSTDDSEIADVARQYGADVLMRPGSLATDEAPMIPVLQHASSEIPAENIVLLQPTSPVRDAGLIDECVREFRKQKADNLATGFTCHLMEYGTYTSRRQELAGFFHDDGNVYVVKSGLIRKGTMMGKIVMRKEISREQNFEIDEEFDFWLSEQILLKRAGASG